MTDARRLTGHLPTLEGWRAVAALMVVVYHGAGPGRPALQHFGRTGVAVFFALSGLLICNRLLAEHGRAGRIDLRGFYVRRTFRILPPAFVYLAVLAVIGAPAATPGELASCLFFWRNYYDGGGWYSGHFWSLAVEEHFYLFFPVLLAWVGPRRALPVAVGLAAALLGWRVLGNHWAWLADRTSAIPQYYRTDCRLPDLLLGAATALVAPRAPGWLVRVAGAAGGAALVARLAGLPLPWVVESAVLPWLLLGTVVRPDGWLGRALEWRPLAWLGRMSYSLYLWQQLFFCGRDRFRLTELGPLQDWPWNLVALLACAAASYYLLERPLTRLGRLLADRRPTGPSTEPQVEARRVVLGWRRWVERPALPTERPASTAKPR